MTPTDYQVAHSGKLKEFLDSKPGKDLLVMLQALRPAMQASFPTEHQMVRSYANNEGYNSCLQNIIALCMPPKPSSEVQADYGVKDKPTKE